MVSNIYEGAHVLNCIMSNAKDTWDFLLEWVKFFIKRAF